MITLSNGHQFKYMAASGALAFDGRGWPWDWPFRWAGLIDVSLFTIVIKTLTRLPEKGNNPFRCVRFIRGGIVNAVRLRNKGIDWWCRKIGPKIDRKKISLVGQIYSEDVGELAGMALQLNDFDLGGLELNISCPNTGAAILGKADFIVKSCEAVKKASRLPIIIKISAAQKPEKFIGYLDGIVEAISINSVPWHLAFPGQKSPLANFGGGAVSGKAAQPVNWELVRKLSSMTKIPIIGPSVWKFDDMRKVRICGAQAVSFGSVFTLPWRPTLFVKKERRDKK